jgi:BirA family biotin operon repressor/biotin-[acetyl-CoA-carboxylase] ligase
LEKSTPFVKLGAVSSTNDFLREMARGGNAENFTAVTAEEQTAGRGQRGAGWHSEKGKNLMMSVLIRDFIVDVRMVFDLNAAVATAVIAVLESHGVPHLSIKWPNDMLSGEKKIGGILIENTIGSAVLSVVGIGINVNQEDFPGLPQAGSMKTATGKTFSKDALAAEIVSQLKRDCRLLRENADQLWQRYHELLFCRGTESEFEDESGERFSGVIRGVRRDGRLEVSAGGALRHFGIREIRMIY